MVTTITNYRNTGKQGWKVLLASKTLYKRSYEGIAHNEIFSS